MERTFAIRGLTLALAMGVAAVAVTAVAMPAEGQTPTRYRVLVPAFEPQEGARANFGRSIANELRQHLDQLGTHEAVDSRELRDALRQYRLREQDLDCTAARQLATQMRVQVVMCGEYWQENGGTRVVARFVNTTAGDVAELDAFVVGHYRDAAQRIAQQFEDFVDLLRSTAFCVDYANSQQWDEAVRVCGQVLESNPVSREALYTKGRAHMEMDELDTAMTYFERLLGLDPVHEDGLLAAGIVTARLNRQEESRRYFNEYLSLNPGNVHVRLQVATEAANEGDPEGALRIAEEGIEQNPDHLELYEYAGHFAMRAAEQLSQAQGANGSPEAPELNRLRELALRHYGRVFDEKGDEADEMMLRNMIATLAQLGRHDEAAELGKRAIAAKPESAQIWFVYADALQRAGKLNDALEALDTVERLDAEFANVDVRRASWLLQAGRLEPARAAIRKAIEAGVEADALARNVFAFGYNERYRRGQHDAAIEFFEFSREIATADHTRAMGAFWIGFIIYQRAERIDEPATVDAAQRSLPLFRRALELFQQSGPYANREGSINLPDILDRARQNIEIQELIIRHRRGR